MPSRMLRGFIFSLAGAISGLVLACTQGAVAETPERGGTLTVGFASDIKTLDPIFSIEYTERQVLYLIFDTLVRLDTDFSVRPELAKSWDVEAGGTRVVLHLREGVKFQDGTPFDAAAVKWNIDRRLDPAVKSAEERARVGGEIGRGGRSAYRRLHPQAAIPGPARHAGPARGIHGVSRGEPEAGCRFRQQPRGHRRVPVQGMGARQPHHGGAQSRLLGQGQALSRSHRLPGRCGLRSGRAAADHRRSRFRVGALASGRAAARGARRHPPRSGPGGALDLLAVAG